MTASHNIANSVGFELLGPRLGSDVRLALKAALSGGVVFSNGSSALSLFRHGLSESIRDIESHPRGWLFKDFLGKGPYEDEGPIPSALAEHRLSDADTAAATAFICSHMVNCFKGAIAEMLASVAGLNLLTRLRQDGVLPPETRLYAGDAVGIHRASGKGVLKGADQHFLVLATEQRTTPGVAVVGVTEIKSYIPSADSISKQLDKHLRRAARGITVDGVEYRPESVRIGRGGHEPVRIEIVPGSWKLPRTFRFEPGEHGRTLCLDEGVPPGDEDVFEQIGSNHWRITLRWSKEALAEAAYEMTFWYMGKVGETLFSKSLPKGWEAMEPAAAGRNAAKQMLNYAVLRARNEREEQRAIGLYNSYGFGFSVGMSFRNRHGKREILYPQDLDEIAASGRTVHEDRLY